MAKMKRLVLKIGGFHLNGEVIDAKTIVKLGAQLPQQIRLRNAFSMYDVRAQCLAAGSDGPNVKIMHVGNAAGVEYRILDRGEIDVRRRTFEQYVCRLFDQSDRAPDDE